MVFGQRRASFPSCWGVFLPVEKGKLCLEIRPEATASCCRPSPFGHALVLVIFYRLCCLHGSMRSQFSKLRQLKSSRKEKKRLLPSLPEWCVPRLMQGSEVTREQAQRL